MHCSQKREHWWQSSNRTWVTACVARTCANWQTRSPFTPESIIWMCGLWPTNTDSNHVDHNHKPLLRCLSIAACSTLHVVSPTLLLKRAVVLLKWIPLWRLRTLKSGLPSSLDDLGWEPSHQQHSGSLLRPIPHLHPTPPIFSLNLGQSVKSLLWRRGSPQGNACSENHSGSRCCQTTFSFWYDGPFESWVQVGLGVVSTSTWLLFWWKGSQRQKW